MCPSWYYTCLNTVLFWESAENIPLNVFKVLNLIFSMKNFLNVVFAEHTVGSWVTLGSCRYHHLWLLPFPPIAGGVGSWLTLRSCRHHHLWLFSLLFTLMAGRSRKQWTLPRDCFRDGQSSSRTLPQQQERKSTGPPTSWGTTCAALSGIWKTLTKPSISFSGLCAWGNDRCLHT